ncbi:hypothetical protein D6789_04690 [Candidatus Woesearchaeota archaeon]|nr:MAG: hypothetical protein D6789_04690 [Candidatus Woesearchaeota archaeon]
MLVFGVVVSLFVLPRASLLVLATSFVTGCYFWWGSRFLSTEGMANRTAAEWILDGILAALLLGLIVLSQHDTRVWLGTYVVLFALTLCKYALLRQRGEQRVQNFARWKLRTDSAALALVFLLFLVGLWNPILAVSGVLVMESAHIIFVCITRPYRRFRRIRERSVTFFARASRVRSSSESSRHQH